MANPPEDGASVQLLRDQELGSGAYGKVFKARYRGSVYAAKEIHNILIDAAPTQVERRILRDNFIRECDYCRKLCHSNIVRLIHIYHPPQQLLPVMIMELMDVSLTAYAVKPDVGFKERIGILRDVAEGLRYLHTCNPPVIHRDLSPNNILLKYLPQLPLLIAKIADLGVAKAINFDNRQYLTKAPGTTDFMPPEALENDPKYDTSLDIFSYGGITLYTVNGIWPKPTAPTKFDPMTGKVMGISEVERRQEHLDKMTGETMVLRALVEACLDNNPVKHPSIKELLEKIKQLKQQQYHCHQQHHWQQQQHQQYQYQKEQHQQHQYQQPCQQRQQQHPQRHHHQQQHLNIKWEEGKPVPVCRVGHSAVWLNGIIYVGGGDEDILGNPSYKIDAYNIATNSWGPQIDTVYHYFSMTCFEGHLTIVGGEDQKNAVTNKVLKLQLDQTGMPTDYIPLQPFKIPRSHTTAVGYHDYLIVAGGTGEKKKSGEGKRLASTEIYISSVERWYSSDNIPKALFNLKPVVVENELYLLGGCDQNGPSQKVFVASLDMLSGHRLKWQEFQNTPLHNSSPVYIYKFLLILGGSDKAAVRVPEDIAVFNRTKGCWEAVGNIPSIRLAPAVVSVGSRIALIGGQDDIKQATNTVWIGTCEPHVQ